MILTGSLPEGHRRITIQIGQKKGGSDVAVDNTLSDRKLIHIKGYHTELP